MDKIKFVALGGLDEEGKNCYCIEINNDIFVIEAGLKFAPRSLLGVDYIIPNNKFLLENKQRVRAYIITHAHDDQYGALFRFINDVPAPIYCSQTTMICLREEYRNKFNKELSHNIVLVDGNSDVQINGYMFRFFNTCHSISQSFGFALQTDLGNIVYTGDFISDYTPIKNFTFDFKRMIEISEQKQTFLLLCESCAALNSGIVAPKHKIKPLIEKYFVDSKDKIFIANYSQNFYNLEEIFKLVTEFNKKLVIVSEKFKKLMEALDKFEILSYPKNNIINASEIKDYDTSEIVVLLTGSGEDVYDLIQNVCHDEIENVVVNRTDTFITNVPSVPGTEVIGYDAIDSIYTTDCNVVNLTRKEILSMHPHQEDIKMAISIFKPKYYIPVKGEYRKLMANAQCALSMKANLNHNNVFILDNGEEIAFDQNGKVMPNCRKIQVGDVLVDGLNVGNIKDETIEERAEMAEDGVIFIGIVVSLRNKKILSQPELQMRGCLYLKDSDDIIDELSEIFKEKILTIEQDRRTNIHLLQNDISNTLYKHMRKKYNKKPRISVNIVNVDKPLKTEQNQSNKTSEEVSQ